MESWRTQVYYAGGLRGDRSPESEPQGRVSQGFYGLVLTGPCLAGRTGKVVDAEAGVQKRMRGGGWLGAAGWTLLWHHGRGVSTFLSGHFLLHYKDSCGAYVSAKPSLASVLGGSSCLPPFHICTPVWISLESLLSQSTGDTKLLCKVWG